MACCIEAGRALLGGQLGVDGVLAGDDPIAMGIIQTAWLQGIDVPGELSVIGYGDSAMSRESDPALSTVQVHRREMANVAVELLMGEEFEHSPGFAERRLILPTVHRRGTIRPA